ncbi:hydantoinase B/oxoprolinase family protein [Glacieibacterium megasporae]|uniref:hydantoinase B/oxoprolinase family protein n=1 Tax=Glacieibacterium megasporae TaxID=2835787 RepID=UPI001C1E1D92|nr:hydantoinase B/oxoprolinase family protein [Polymorphobacter megasporae]UAJ11507.1 hydantoinase B/oxoprolinase family protein [Polymorphobacter megasporae]
MGWNFWIDRGGTFTDIVARRPDGGIATLKLLSSASAYADAAIEGIARLRGDEPVDMVRMGTTVATNALLERAGEPVVLAITRGFGDALRIGHQARPRLFDRQIVLPEPLYDSVVEIDERVDAEGEVLRPLDGTATLAALSATFGAGYRAIAIVLMHGYRFTAHEERVAAIARAVGFTQVSVSHDIAALIKFVPRGDTTVVDAYLSPILGRYVEQVGGALGDTPLLFMQSNGGLVAARDFRGKDAILSGPAGGIVGMVATARAAGFDRLIGFDMGGTSTDVSHYAGAYERSTEALVAGVRIRVPMLAIDTVAAGGGSICRWDGTRLRVGPESAGAVPGPAAYRGGGPLTVTDANVLLGKLQPDHFPALFGPGGDQPLDRDVVVAKFAALGAETGIAPMTLAAGFVDIAVATMARAIRSVSIERGHDVAGYTLVCMGGAAGQHACLVAAALGIGRVMVSPYAGVLSALGIGLADIRVLREATIDLPLGVDIVAAANALATAAETALHGQLVTFDRVELVRTALVKYAGTDTPLEVAIDNPVAMAKAFAAQHVARFGFASEAPLVIDALRVEAVGSTAAIDIATPEPAGDPTPIMVTMAETPAPLFNRATLPVGFVVTGPAIIVDASATTVVEPGWRAEVDGGGNLILTRSGELVVLSAASSDTVDPIRLELFAHRFMGIAEAMGVALQSTAASVNIKERLDFSCALFDADGSLIANAPHMPVHLGSMGESVAAVRRRRDGLRPGDVVMLNAPYNGGTHLPDITAIMPVFIDDEPAPAFFVAARGHHADIGGIPPGSMPANSVSVEEEGVLIDDVLLVDAGVFREDAVRALLGSGAYAARNPDQNIGDLKAQVAACARGAGELRTLCAEVGRDTVEAYMRFVMANAEEAVRRAIAGLADGAFDYPMDNGAVVRVAVRIDRERRAATVDFTGTSAQLPSNFNAPRSVVRAAVLYVFRCLIDDDIPLNDGCMRAIEVVVPPGSMLDPAYPAAVVAGNVETSQVITDALFGALGVMAGAQGTMNNFTFGNARHQYYETIAGGSGAGAGFVGTSAVQTHMTNSRLTDPEVLESRFPVLVDSFAIRRGSGGAGEWRGGDGVVRQIRFREAATAGILSNRRLVPPFGLAGGGAGAAGENSVERADGSVERLGSTATVDMAPGDVFIVATPGGGGYGEAE